MRLALITAVAVLLPWPATAQSLSDTHDLVWHPAGKTPVVTYRPRDKPACHQPRVHLAGKGHLPAPSKCKVAATVEKTAERNE